MMRTTRMHPAAAPRTTVNRPLLLFFGLAFALAWSIGGLAILQHRGVIGDALPVEPLLILGAWTPNLAAFIVLGLVIKRRGSLRALLMGWAKWDVEPIWYLVVLSPMLFALITIPLYTWLYGTSPSTGLLMEPQNLMLLLVMITLTGATGEQLGWRGFALPWLQTKLSALTASVLLGLIWSAWHIPLWFAGIGFESTPFWAYTLIGVAFSVLVTWACNHTRGSMVIASLFHLFLNVSVNMIRPEAYPLLAVVFMLAAAGVVGLCGPHTLSKQGELPIDPKTKSWIA